MGPVCFFCDSLSKGKRGKSRSFKGTGREGLPQIHFSGNPFCPTGLVGREDFFEGLAAFFLFSFLEGLRDGLRREVEV